MGSMDMGSMDVGSTYPDLNSREEHERQNIVHLLL